MRFLRAKIDGFGRYSGREFEFDDGINVIYGKNEAGKSTLQHFLLAMLFGMKKPGRKRAVYLEEEAKYRPWQGGAYGGVLWLEAEGVVYRIERSLRRDDEWVRIYRQDTGEELTGRFPVDSRKEVRFAETLFGADRDLFTHALCIGPVDERDRMLRLRESVRAGGEGGGSDALSPEQGQVRLAEEAIAKRLDALGSERAATKPLGQAVKAREEANRAYLDAIEREASHKGARREAEQSDAHLQEAVRDEAMLREDLAGKLALFLNVQTALRGDLLARMELLQKALDDNEQSDGLDLDEADFRELQQDFQRLETAKYEAEKFQKRLEALTEESREAVQLASRYQAVEDTGLQEVERLAHDLELVEQSPNFQLEERDPGELAELETAYRKKRRLMWWQGAVALLFLPFCFTEWAAVAGVLLFLGGAVLNYFSALKIGQAITVWEEERESERVLREAAHTQQQRLEAKLLELLARFEVDTPRQYRQKWMALVKAREQATQFERQSVWLSGEMNRARGERDILARRVLRKIGGEAADTDRLREEIVRWERRFEESRALKEQASVWRREHDELRHQVQAVEKELERWAAIAEQLQVVAEPMTIFTQGTEIAAADLERLYQSWQMAERFLLEKKNLYTEANTRYQTLQEGQQRPADLLLEKQRAEEEWRRLADERDALLLAQEVWAEVQEEMYRTVAPQFASGLAEVTERITQGRYRELYVDREEAISTVSPDSGYTVQLSSLSEGTIDQITFALGLAVSGWTIPGGERLPLLLDEPFRRYDDDRLQSVIELLLEEAEGRQIFLFTCREQEVERLVELSQGKYGMINLEIQAAGRA